jgi:hypothetical protein
MNRSTLSGLMSAVIFALMLLSAPAAHAQVAAQDSVLLDPFDPVPEIQFRHFGGNGCWDDCGTRDCDGCGGCRERCGCHSSCARRCYSGCSVRRRCYEDCYGRAHCERGCHPSAYRDHGYDRGRRFDRDADRMEEDHERFRRDAREYERDDRAWHQRFDDQWDRDGKWLGDGHWGPDGKWAHNGHWADKEHYVRDGYWDRDGSWINDANADNDGNWDRYDLYDRDNHRGSPNLDPGHHDRHVGERPEQRRDNHEEDDEDE